MESELKTGRRKVKRRVSKKLESVLGRNVGYNTLCYISKVLTGESFDIFCIDEELTAGDLVNFKYAQLYQWMWKAVSPDTKMCFPTTGVP